MISKKYIFFFIFVFSFLTILRMIFDNPIHLWEDHDIALNLVNEGEFYYESDGARNHTFQFPIYSTCLAIIYSMTETSVFAVVIFNIFIHVSTSRILYFLFHLILGYLHPTINQSKKDKVVFVALLFFLFHPVLLVYSFYHVHPLQLNIFSLFSGLYFSMRFAMNPDKKNLVMAGSIIGICMLDRATVSLTLIPATIILWQNNGFIEAIKKMFLVTSISLLIVSPWLIRNYRMDGIIGFESSAAKNIWKGVLYDSDGSNYLLNGENYYSALTEEEKIGLGKMSPLEQRDFFNAKYKEILRNDPGHVVKMFFVKLKSFWWFRQGAGTEWGEWKRYLPLYKILYGISLSLILYFLYKNFKNGILLMSFPLALSILQSYFYVETRHRIAIEPYLFFLSILSFFYIYDEFLSRHKSVS